MNQYFPKSALNKAVEQTTIGGTELGLPKFQRAAVFRKGPPVEATRGLGIAPDSISSYPSANRPATCFLNCVGVIPFTSQNRRLKFATLLNPTA